MQLSSRRHKTSLTKQFWPQRDFSSFVRFHFNNPFSHLDGSSILLRRKANRPINMLPPSHCNKTFNAEKKIIFNLKICSSRLHLTC